MKRAVLVVLRLLAASTLAATSACGDIGAGVSAREPGPSSPPSPARQTDAHPSNGGEQTAEADAPPPLTDPIPLWVNGEVDGDIDATTARREGFVVLDLGEAWAPYLFTTRSSETEEERPNAYRETYLALARGEFPDNHHGERARSDKYLEHYGILPTLGLLRERMRTTTNQRECVAELNYQPLIDFDDYLSYQNRDQGRRFAQRARVVERQVEQLVHARHVASRAELDQSTLNNRDQRLLDEYDRTIPAYRAIIAAQERLECEGFFEDKGTYVRGGLDWATHEALAEFERRHRIIGWGVIGRETLEMLRRTPAEADQESVIRVLTERGMHAGRFIEDGSVQNRQYTGVDGARHEVPNLEGQLRTMLIESFGLQTPESTLAFLEQLGELPADGHLRVALQGPRVPEYYSDDMDFRVEIDRGDVWYEFPVLEGGSERPQPVERRPHLTLFVQYNDQRIPLVRLGTTIGGWRREMIDDTVWLKYKNSPTGPVIWQRIVAAPVWLPPESAPPRELLTRVPRGRGAEAYRVNYHEVGPSYASAYGLVVAYHSRYAVNEDGTYRIGEDEGIRTHGSVDYMSIMRRHSHGCHRLHNYLAVRMMSFVLGHRPHTRVGQQQLGYRRLLEYEEHEYTMEIDTGGYEFQLETPIRVNVLEGRIRGNIEQPIREPMPRWNSDIGAFMLPDGGAVQVSRGGELTPVPVPLPDGAVSFADGGVLADGGAPIPIPVFPGIPATNISTTAPAGQ